MTLPIRVEPIPGESLVSWLAAHAQRMRCWWGEVLAIVLPTYAQLGDYARDLRLVAHLSDDQLEAIAQATHTDAAAVAAMTLEGRYGQSLITIDPDTGRPDSPWGKISRQRFCPLCLKADPGRDRLDWLLPWIATCPEHRCYLADACAPGGHHQCVSPTWLHLLTPPQAVQCRGIVHTPSAPARGIRCTARLSNAPVVRIRRGDPVLAAQQTLREWLSHSEINRGLYSSAPASPHEVLQDVLQLSGRLLSGVDGTDLLNLWEYRATEHRVAYWDNTLRLRQAGQDNGIKSTRIVAAPAATVGAWVTTALQILMKPSITAAADALRVAKRTMGKPAPERNPPVCARYSSALTAAEILSRTRCVDVFAELAPTNDRIQLQCPQNGGAREEEGDSILRAIRAGLWVPWTLGLDTGLLSWTMHCQTLTRLLLAMESTMTGPAANRQLHIHPRANSSIGAAARLLYAHPRWDVIHEALERLRRYLRTTPPIDYQRRRQLDYRNLLNNRQWDQVASLLDVSILDRPGGPGAVRNWLIEQLGGPPARNADGRLMPRDGLQDVLRAQLSVDLLAMLDSIAMDFLQAGGIRDEPLRWTPPTRLLKGLDLPGMTAAAIRTDQLHDLLDHGYTVFGVSRAHGVPVEAVRYALEQHPRHEHASAGPKPVPTPALDWLRKVLPETTLRDLYERQRLPRQTIVKRVAAEHGRSVDHRTLESLMGEYHIELRPIPRPTAEWIKGQYIDGGRTLTDIAAELGVTVDTVTNYARRYDIPTHRYKWRYDQDPRVLQLLETLGIDPNAYDERLTSTHTWNDLQILVETSRHSSFSAAAAALGVLHG
jgi:hypothetical protein